MSHNPDNMLRYVEDLKQRLKISKVICTRSIKGTNGEVFVGFAADIDSTQEDSGRGADLMDTKPSDSGRMSVLEATIAAYILGSKVDRLAVDRALIGGLLTQNAAAKYYEQITDHYAKLVIDEINSENSDTDSKSP